MTDKNHSIFGSFSRLDKNLTTSVINNIKSEIDDLLNSKATSQHQHKNCQVPQILNAVQKRFNIPFRLMTHKSPVMTQRYAHLRDDALQGKFILRSKCLYYRRIKLFKNHQKPYAEN